MIRLAICDDDNENLHYMKETINEAFLNSDYNGEIVYNLFHTGEELVNANIANKLDIVFMDIELENKSIGFDIARKLCRQNKDIAIIYMSNHDHYVTKSFVCRPLGFIRKKYASEDLKMVMDEIKLYLGEEYKTITFNNNTKTLELNVNDIYSVEVFNHKLRIVLKNNKDITVRDQIVKHIGELEENGFIQVRRGIVVNARYIDNIKETTLIMSNGETYPIGRENVTRVKQQWLCKKLL